MEKIYLWLVEEKFNNQHMAFLYSFRNRSLDDVRMEASYLDEFQGKSINVTNVTKDTLQETLDYFKKEQGEYGFVYCLDPQRVESVELRALFNNAIWREEYKAKWGDKAY